MRTKEQTFYFNLTKLEIEEFLGVARILKVSLIKDDKKTPKDFYDVFLEVMAAYQNAPKKLQRELREVVRSACRTKNSKN